MGGSKSGSDKSKSASDVVEAAVYAADAVADDNLPKGTVGPRVCKDKCAQILAVLAVVFSIIALILIIVFFVV